MRSFEVESISRKENDSILDIAILPNRAADCLSHSGVAGEIAAILNLKIENPSYKLTEDNKLKIKDFVNVEIKDGNLCPRYAARAITEIEVRPSPRWLKEKLETCGLRSINNVVDATNYVMLETGQPLHAFDLDKIESANSKSQTKKIIIRKARKGENIITLDNEKYELDEDVLVIADAIEPLAIAGIKGGKRAEIGDNTKNIILESANFDRLNIYRTSKKLNLRTDSSSRFSSGLDQNLAPDALDRLAALIKEIAGGKIAKGSIDVCRKKTFSLKIKLDLDCATGLLGADITAKEIKHILENLGFKIKAGKKSKIFNIEVPTKRLDISIQEDLIEEIGRIYNYEKIKPIFPLSALVPAKRNLNIFWETKTKDILKETGFSEVYNYSFIGDKEANIFNYQSGGLIELENPISLEQKYLRSSLIPGLLKNIKYNLNNFKKVEIFELGKVYNKIKNEFKENKFLAGAIAEKEVKSKDKKFYRTKGILDLLFKKIGAAGVHYFDCCVSKDDRSGVWNPKKCAEIRIGDEKIGCLGEIHSKILDAVEISEKVVFFYIYFEKLRNFMTERKEYSPISRYPAAMRDLAILVPKPVKVKEVFEKIKTAAGDLASDIELFDVYEGKGLPEGKKNLAFHIVYQSSSETLSFKEVDEVQNKIIKNLEENPEWEVRK